MKKYLSIDIGGSSIKYAKIDENMKIMVKGSIETSQNDLQLFINCIKQIYTNFDDISGLALSLAGTINPDTGLIMLCGAFDYLRGYNIYELLSSFCKVPISIENDANCAALAEINCGNLKGIQNAIMVLLGSSIGGAIIHGGNVYRGKHYSAGEFSLIKTEGSDDGLQHLWRNKNGKNGLLRLVQRYLKTQSVYSGIEIFEMANKGNEQVYNAINEFTHLLAIQLYNLQAAFDPEVIAIGGGISNEPLLYKLLKENLLNIFNQEKKYHLAIVEPQIVPCYFRNDANLIGALLHFLISKNI